jgi:hypothetical protein
MPITKAAATTMTTEQTLDFQAYFLPFAITIKAYDFLLFCQKSH